VGRQYPADAEAGSGAGVKKIYPPARGPGQAPITQIVKKIIHHRDTEENIKVFQGFFEWIPFMLLENFSLITNTIKGKVPSITKISR